MPRPAISNVPSSFVLAFTTSVESARLVIFTSAAGTPWLVVGATSRPLTLVTFPGVGAAGGACARADAARGNQAASNRTMRRIRGPFGDECGPRSRSSVTRRRHALEYQYVPTGVRNV